MFDIFPAKMNAKERKAFKTIRDAFNLNHNNVLLWNGSSKLKKVKEARASLANRVFTVANARWWALAELLRATTECAADIKDVEGVTEEEGAVMRGHLVAVRDAIDKDWINNNHKEYPRSVAGSAFIVISCLLSHRADGLRNDFERIVDDAMSEITERMRVIGAGRKPVIPTFDDVMDSATWFGVWLGTHGKDGFIIG